MFIHLAQTVQEFMHRFLFDPGFQELGVRICDSASKVLVRHDSTNTQSVFPVVKQPGDLDTIAHFFPVRIETANKTLASVNELNGFLCMSGMPPIEIVVKKLRELILCGSDRGKAGQYPNLMGKALLDAMRQTFPHANEFAGTLVDLQSVELDLTPVTGGIMVQLHGELNISKLEELYPAMASLLKHLSELDFSIIDLHDPGASSYADASTAKCMMQVRIVYLKGVIELQVRMMLPDTDSNHLLWFDRASKKCVLTPKGEPWPVEFVESSVDWKKSFRVVIDGTMRIPQLGCGSIALPLIVIELRCSASKLRFSNLYGGESPAHRFDITILHMTDKRITALLLRPFFNLDLLRFILLNHFHMQMEVIPPTKAMPLATPAKNGAFPQDEDYEEFFDAREDEDPATVHEEVSITHPPRRGSLSKPDDVSPHWFFVSKVHMYLPQPPKVITTCLSLFVGEQMASPDDVQLLIDMMSALSKDVKQMHARLARAEGDEQMAKLVEEDLKAEVETQKRRASITGVDAAAKPKKVTWRRRFFWFLY